MSSWLYHHHLPSWHPYLPDWHPHWEHVHEAASHLHWCVSNTRLFTAVSSPLSALQAASSVP